MMITKYILYLNSTQNAESQREHYEMVMMNAGANQNCPTENDGSR
jgi:hypothetical protein